MKITQWIRCYNTENDELMDEWLIHEFEDLPEYWEECLRIEYPVACVLLGKCLDERFREYFLEMEAER
jgi:hypothetical protein